MAANGVRDLWLATWLWLLAGVAGVLVVDAVVFLPNRLFVFALTTVLGLVALWRYHGGRLVRAQWTDTKPLVEELPGLALQPMPPSPRAGMLPATDRQFVDRLFSGAKKLEGEAARQWLDQLLVEQQRERSGGPKER